MNMQERYIEEMKRSNELKAERNALLRKQIIGDRVRNWILHETMHLKAKEQGSQTIRLREMHDTVKEAFGEL